MNVDKDLPQVALLREAVNNKLGFSPRLPAHFQAVADEIAKTTGVLLSQSTMERFWGYSTRTTRYLAEHTLDVLSRFVGYENWPHFEVTAVNRAHPDSGFISGETIDIGNLTPGIIIRLAWLPDRMVKVKYCGCNKFVVEQAVNSSMSPGDTFECLAIQKGQPLYLDRYRKASDGADGECLRYVAGRNSGLTDVLIYLKCGD